MKNVDMKVIKHGIDIYQNYFPERMNRCYVIGLPPALLGVWSLIEKMMDQRSRERMNLMNKPTKLLKLLDKQFVPETFGGECKLSHEPMMQIYERLVTNAGQEGTNLEKGKDAVEGEVPVQERETKEEK
eukprot:TRINITY_DN2249_c0_g1_i4.p1 TRINITY_DN2249_c0_g1~~TRINITY_DN2249_c0_g1_i4.p1  ORF type:complete len:129 (-),score=31.11 TRINITY_DN2249_c0_g1_i4:38-424(-)